MKYNFPENIFVLDNMTIVGVLFWGNILIAILIFGFYKTYKKLENRKDFLLFGIAKLIQSITWFLFFSRGSLPNWMTINVCNSFIFISFFLESIVVLSIINKNSLSIRKAQFVLMLLSLFVFNVSEALLDQKYWIATSSFMGALICVTPTFQYLKQAPNNKFHGFFGLTYLILFIILLLRAISPFVKTEMIQNSGEIIQGSIFLVILLIMMVNVFGLFLLVLLESNERNLRTRQELELSNATKDKFFSIIAHDLSNPFNSIMAFSNLMLEHVQAKNYNDVEGYAEIVKNASHQSISLLANLMEWSRSQTGRMNFNPEHFDANDLILDINGLLNASVIQKSITFSMDLPPNAILYADKAMISTILRNLISNAIKFSNIGGKIQLTLEQNPNELVFSVTDDGIGMKKETLQKLFRIDESISTVGTQNERGTGLGLILCKEFVNHHQGKIWIESNVGNGTTISFLIPNAFN
jgi:two-component system, sensor histidine kinase and response regulator